MFAWASWHTLVPLLVGTAGLILFVMYEALVAKEPFLLGSIFRDRNAKLVYLQAFMHGLVVCQFLVLELFRSTCSVHRRVYTNSELYRSGVFYTTSPFTTKQSSHIRL